MFEMNSESLLVKKITLSHFRSVLVMYVKGGISKLVSHATVQVNKNQHKSLPDFQVKAF